MYVTIVANHRFDLYDAGPESQDTVTRSVKRDTFVSDRM